MSSSVVLIGASVQKISSGTGSRRLYVEAIDCLHERQPDLRRRRVDRHGHRRTTLAAGNEICALVFLLGPEFLRAGIPLPLPDPAREIGKRS
jgi:hypothetical protein